MLLIILFKYIVYTIIGALYDITPLTPIEEFWLWDLPINPMNVPSIVIFNKCSKDPEEMMDDILKCVRHDTHCDLKLVKIMGKYFFKKLSDDEYYRWKKTNTGVLADITTD